ncbi:putative senescence regulator S40 [Helianthus debilis subsp. tardiflorus]
MDSNGVTTFRHRRSPSSDRFLGVFSPPSSSGVISGSSSVTGDDFSEDDVFWTGDFAEQKCQSLDPATNGKFNGNGNQSFRQPDKFGILAALPEDPANNGLKPNRSVMNRRNPTIQNQNNPSSSRLIPAIPRPNKQERCSGDVPIVSQSMPLKFQQSAPVNVPVFTRKPTFGRELADVDIGDDDEEEMLPPHEIVAKSSKLPHTTFSVLEGAGRTLKGRDLRLVRNAVWRKTGFLD